MKKATEIYEAAHSAVAAWMYKNGLIPRNYISVDNTGEFHEIYFVEADIPEELKSSFNSLESWEELAFSLEEYFIQYNDASQYQFNLYDISLYECPECGEQVVEVILYR